MGRAPCCDKANVKRGPWSPQEDATLKTYLETHGTGGNWIALPKKAGLKRCGKSCRLRWLNYLRPDIKHGGFTEDEDNIICTLYSQMGSRWSTIASQLPGRTDNDVKNYWNTKLKKKLMAGKVSLKTMTDNDTLPSNLLLTQNQNVETRVLYQSSTLSALPISNINASSEFDINQKSMRFDAIHQVYGPRVMDGVSQNDVNSRNNFMVSLSQEGSSISSSSEITMDNVNKCVAEDEAMNPDFGFPYDIVNGLYYHEIDEFEPSCCPELIG